MIEVCVQDLSDNSCTENLIFLLYKFRESSKVKVKNVYVQKHNVNISAIEIVFSIND